MMGHAAPAVFQGLVVASGVGSFGSGSLAEYRRMGRSLQLRLLRSALLPGQVEVHSGQVFLALELHDGSIRWRSHLFGDPRLVPGHTAGTATFGTSTGVIVLPVSDSVVAFDPLTGATRWTSGANGARGAPLILEDQVVIAGRNGLIEVRQLADGALRCTVRRAVGWDRAGPSVSGDLAIFANLDGEVEAIPTRTLRNCPTANAPEIRMGPP
jgi:outer membrane protein assembly factor BamB